MIHLPGPLVATIADVVTRLRHHGDTELCDRLLSQIAGEYGAPSLPAPPVTRRIRTPDERDADRIRKAEKRSQYKTRNIAVRHSSDGGQRRTDGGQNGGQSTPRARVPNQEEKRKASEFRAVAAEIEYSEESVRSETRACPPSCPTADNGGRMADRNALWRQVFDVWKQAAHDGKSCGEPSRSRGDCESIAKDALSRCPNTPLLYATQVIERYVAARRQSGKPLQLRFLASDFASYADAGAPGAPSVSPKAIEFAEAKKEWLAAKESADRERISRAERRYAAAGKSIANG